MLAHSLFDAFTGLAVILGFAITAAVFLCLPKPEGDGEREWTLQPGRRRSMK